MASAAYLGRKRRSVSKDRPRPPSYPIVFLGDTLIHKWVEQGLEIWNRLYAPLNAFNHATVNESTLMLVEKLEREEIPLEHTRTVVLQIGGTDLRCKIKVKVVVEQLRKIVLLLQQSSPGVKILLLGILPRGVDKELYASVRQTNGLLADLENGFTIRWLDLWSHFVEEDGITLVDGLYNTDGVNLSPEGYQLWGNEMASLFDECMPRDIPGIQEQ